ncbi:MAG: MarR family transcriptional regulator [Halieaceae bacterium]|nr:MarR family transcriptional regulator [Halieaceae bacterium]
MNTQGDDEPSQGATRRLSTNLARLLREFSRDLDRRVTHKLRERGHTDFSLSHQVVFANMGLGRTRVTELAERARITQQAMGKTLRELESLGYVERSVDPRDRRARAIRLTPRGIQLVEDAVGCFEEARREYAAKIGERELDELEERLRSAASRLELDYLPTSWAQPGAH